MKKENKIGCGKGLEEYGNEIDCGYKDIKGIYLCPECQSQQELNSKKNCVKCKPVDTSKSQFNLKEKRILNNGAYGELDIEKVYMEEDIKEFIRLEDELINNFRFKIDSNGCVCNLDELKEEREKLSGFSSDSSNTHQNKKGFGRSYGYPIQSPSKVNQEEKR